MKHSVTLNLCAFVPQNVANALHNASDHLPVYISLIFINATQSAKSTVFSHSVIEEKASATIYPNLFKRATTIEYVIPENSFVSLAIFDLHGNKIANLVNEYREKGCYKAEFIASPSMSNGMYYYSLQSGKTTVTQKLFLIK